MSVNTREKRLLLCCVSINWMVFIVSVHHCQSWFWVLRTKGRETNRVVCCVGISLLQVTYLQTPFSLQLRGRVNKLSKTWSQILFFLSSYLLSLKGTVVSESGTNTLCVSGREVCPYFLSFTQGRHGPWDVLVFSLPTEVLVKPDSQGVWSIRDWGSRRDRSGPLESVSQVKEAQS